MYSIFPGFFQSWDAHCQKASKKKTENHSVLINRIFSNCTKLKEFNNINKEAYNKNVKLHPVGI